MVNKKDINQLKNTSDCRKLQLEVLLRRQ